MTNQFSIHPAKAPDLPLILEIYEHARRFMRETGNPTQWSGGHPAPRLLKSDIEKGDLYVLTDGGEIAGVFALIFGEDLTYRYIENGSWLSGDPYATIHRIASSGRKHGILQAAAGFALSKIPHLRIDTHEDNAVMQHLLIKLGFSRRGIIYLENGDPRVAFEKLGE